MHLPEELISLYIGCIQLLCLHLRGEGERRGIHQIVNLCEHEEGVCITATGNFLTSGNLCLRVFKLQLKVINKSFCYLYSV